MASDILVKIQSILGSMGHSMKNLIVGGSNGNDDPSTKRRRMIFRFVFGGAMVVSSIYTALKYIQIRESTRRRRWSPEKYSSIIENDMKFDHVEFVTPEPGVLSTADYRFPASPFANYGNHDLDGDTKLDEKIRVVTWDIGKGNRKITGIIEMLENLDADIVCLQNVDVNCQRSFRANVVCEIGAQLGYNVIYGCESWHNDVWEDDADIGRGSLNGSVSTMGVSGRGGAGFTNDHSDSLYKYNSKPVLGSCGNAILTRFDVVHAYPLILPCVRSVSRPKHDHHVRHTVPVVVVKTSTGDEIAVYCVSMDTASDKNLRALKQFEYIYRDITAKHSGIGGTSTATTLFQRNQWQRAMANRSRAGQSSSKTEKYRRSRQMNARGNAPGNEGSDSDGPNGYKSSDDDEEGHVDDDRLMTVKERIKVENKRRTCIVAGNFESMESGKSWLETSEALYWKRHVIGYDQGFSASNLQHRSVHFKDPFDVERDWTTRIYKTVLGLDFETWRGKTDWLLYDVGALKCVNSFICTENDLSDHNWMVADFHIRAVDLIDF